MESLWVCNWFMRLVNFAETTTLEERKKMVFIADRSPFSAVCYANKMGHLLESVIRGQIEEIRNVAEIEIYTIYVSVNREKLWERITERLVVEPSRKKYNEDKIE